MFCVPQFSHESQLLQVRQSAHGERGLDGLNETGWWWSGEDLPVRRKRTCVCACFIYSMCFVLCCVHVWERERKKRPPPPPPPPTCSCNSSVFWWPWQPGDKTFPGSLWLGPRVGVKFGCSEKTVEEGEQDGGGGGGGWRSYCPDGRLREHFCLYSSSVWLNTLMSA